MSREAFEKWAQGKSLLINIREEMMYAAGGYINVKEMAWEAWQAALALQHAGQEAKAVATVENGVLNWLDGCQVDGPFDLVIAKKALLSAGKENNNE